MAQSIINTSPVLKDPVTGGFVSAPALASTCSTDGVLKITDSVNICQTFGKIALFDGVMTGTAAAVHNAGGYGKLSDCQTSS